MLNLKKPGINCGHMWVNSDCALEGKQERKEKPKRNNRENCMGHMSELEKPSDSITQPLYFFFFFLAKGIQR